jgi:hypothetical protein
MGATDSGEPCCYCENWLAEEVAMVQVWAFLVKSGFKPLR